MGWNTEGLDLDRLAVEAARSQSLNVRCEAAEYLHACRGECYVVTLSHFIEHLYDPVGFLKELYGLLRARGVLWLDTPNLDSKGHRRFGSS